MIAKREKKQHIRIIIIYIFVVVTVNMADVLDDPGIGEMMEGLNFGKGQNLPERYGKRPNVRFTAKFTLNS